MYLIGKNSCIHKLKYTSKKEERTNKYNSIYYYVGLIILCEILEVGSFLLICYITFEFLVIMSVRRRYATSQMSRLFYICILYWQDMFCHLWKTEGTVTWSMSG